MRDQRLVLGQFQLEVVAQELGEAGFDLFGGQIETDLAFLPVNRDRITIADNRNRATDVSLGRDMANHEPVAAAGESPVRDQPDIFAILHL